MGDKIKELEHGAILLGLDHKILGQEIANSYITDVLNKFNPYKATGHLSVGSPVSKKLSTEEHEFSFSENLPDEPIYIFFEQDNTHKGQVFILNQAQMLGMLLKECFGMEYFISNKEQTYLISVNWYTIEILGLA